MPGDTVALIDTMVASALYISPKRARQHGRPVDRWLRLLSGMRVVVSFQTRAEVIAGIRASNWGDKRRRDAVSRLNRLPTVGVDEAVIGAFAELFAKCKSSGHALHAKKHTADRWIAACAIAKDIALLSDDHIFVEAPGIKLLE